MQKCGKRAGTVAAAYQPKRMSRNPAVKKSDTRMEKGLIQFVICCAVFVLMVAVKLLLPGKMTVVNARIDAAMEHNMDVKAAFSAVGSLFTEKKTVNNLVGEVYQAVFQIEEPRGIQTAAQYSFESPIALSELQHYRIENTEKTEEIEQPSENDTANLTQEESARLTYVLYSDQNLPENVSMEQTILGLDYCVPVKGEISSNFGYRDHPVEGEERFHYGLDLAADTGTAICCFAEGTVSAVGESSSYGKYCIVNHENGCSTLYAHCSKILTSSGKTVAKEEKIAEVGQSGMATGPHLHFELQKDGIYLNPIYYVSAR